MAGLGFADEVTESLACQQSQCRAADRRVGRRGMETSSHRCFGFAVWPEDTTAPFWALGSLAAQGRVGLRYLRVPNFG